MFNGMQTKCLEYEFISKTLFCSTYIQMLGPIGQNSWAQTETSPKAPIPHLLPPHTPHSRILPVTFCTTDNTAHSLKQPWQV